MDRAIYDAFKQAASDDPFNRITALHHAGVPIGYRRATGENAMMAAASQGRVDWMRRLKAMGAETEGMIYYASGRDAKGLALEWEIEREFDEIREGLPPNLSDKQLKDMLARSIRQGERLTERIKELEAFVRLLSDCEPKRKRHKTK